MKQNKKLKKALKKTDKILNKLFKKYGLGKRATIKSTKIDATRS
ncbi:MULTISPECIES: hypothetical protein [unclassified Helicobacter]|nr:MULTISPECIES: hypothetical protein [unclassified Helicobacter]